MELHYISMFPFKLLAAVCYTIYIMHINSRKNTVVVNNPSADVLTPLKGSEDNRVLPEVVAGGMVSCIDSRKIL